MLLPSTAAVASACAWAALSALKPACSMQRFMHAHASGGFSSLGADLPSAMCPSSSSLTPVTDPGHQQRQEQHCGLQRWQPSRPTTSHASTASPLSMATSPTAGRIGMAISLLPFHTPNRRSCTSLLAAAASPSSARHLSSSPIEAQLKGIRQSFQLPPNPFTYRPARDHSPKLVLYRGKGMLLFRFLVRMKVFQLAGAFTAATLFSMMVTADDRDPVAIAAASAVVLGCIVTSYCIWFYSSRYVGELSLVLPERDRLCFSVLDFWGNRHDAVVPLSDLDPPFRNRSIAEVKAMVRPVLMPLKIRGGQDFYISMGHGIVKDEQVLSSILYGVAPIGTTADFHGDNPGCDWRGQGRYRYRCAEPCHGLQR